MLENYGSVAEYLAPKILIIKFVDEKLRVWFQNILFYVCLSFMIGGEHIKLDDYPLWKLPLNFIA